MQIHYMKSSKLLSVFAMRAVSEQTGRGDIWIGGGALPAVMTMRGPGFASIGNPPVQFDSIPTLK